MARLTVSITNYRGLNRVWISVLSSPLIRNHPYLMIKTRQFFSVCACGVAHWKLVSNNVWDYAYSCVEQLLNSNLFSVYTLFLFEKEMNVSVRYTA